jgi:isopenicillin-N epimerase
MNRRQAAAAAALLGVTFTRKAAAATSSLPDHALLAKTPEKYWQQLREEQFFLPAWRAFLNNGSLGVMPKPVFQKVADYLQTGASLTTDVYPRWGYELMDEHRQALAAFIGCHKDELAITHSATTAMSIIAAGLDLAPGDEVLITDQEHPSGRGCWQMKAARSGIALREVAIPQSPKSASELADKITAAIGPRTKVLSFSGITTTTGLILPIKDICTYARSKGVITVVDGAHMHGQIPVNAHDLGCDFMAGSPHKWMFAPPGSGLLYIREEMLDRLWPTIVTGNWDDKKLKAARYMMIGTNNRAIVEGMVGGIDFIKAIGFDTIRARTRQLAQMCIDRAKQMPDLIELVTPEDPSMHQSLVTVRFKKDPQKVQALARKRRIWLIGAHPLRIAVNVHTRPSDLDFFFETVKEALV